MRFHVIILKLNILVVKCFIDPERNFSQLLNVAAKIAELIVERADVIDKLLRGDGVEPHRFRGDGRLTIHRTGKCQHADSE